MRSRLALLAGQTFALGLMVAFLVVPASALFLGRYGAAALPYAYLAVAAAGVAISTLMRRAQERVSLARLATGVLAIYITIVAAAWLVLWLADGGWATFPLLVLFPMIIPIGFVLIGAQAGRLLDVQQMKARLPRVIAGFSVGFGGGGLLAAVLVGPLGGAVHLLAIDAGVGVALLALMADTARRFPAELRAAPAASNRTAAERPRLATLLGNRLVLAVFAYQVLSAGVSQLLDFMVWERAAERYPDADDIARFQGLFGAVINIVAIVFVALVAGRLLKRWGVGLGLAANPLVVAVAVAVGSLVGFGAGAATTAFFFLVCSQQVLDIALTDGMTRTSINATYQALPAHQQLPAQTGVEAAGVPLALGVVGAFLLVHQGLDLDVRVVQIVTLVLAIVWTVLALAAYRAYGAGLRQLVGTPPWTPVQPWGITVPTEPESAADVDVRGGLGAHADRVARVLAVLAALDTIDASDGVAPLRSALHDEITAAAGQATELLATAYGREPVVRAVAALGSSSAQRRALAVEMLETTCGRSARMALALVDPTLDATARGDRLADRAIPPDGDASTHVIDLIVDAEGTWSKSWLRVCALYAAPAVLGERTVTFAERFVDDPDGDVAATARWAASEAARRPVEGEVVGR